MWADCDERGAQAELPGGGDALLVAADASRRDDTSDPARAPERDVPMPVSASGDKRSSRQNGGLQDVAANAHAGAPPMGTPPPPRHGDLYASSTSPSSGEDQPPEPGLALAGAASSPGAAGLSSMWLNWENPRAVMQLCSESEGGSALEMRRQKNRESMRRSRQRARDQLQNLRDVVAQLEKQYTALCLKSEPLHAASRSPTERNRRYADAVELSKRLGAENLYLKASIQSQASWKLELHRVMETTVVLDAFTASASSPPSPFPFKLEILNEQEAASIYGFHPVLTSRDVKDLILDNSRTVKRVRNLLLSGATREIHQDDALPSAHVADDADVGMDSSRGQHETLGPVTRSELFGWDMRRRVRGNEMEFVFTKQFYGISMSEVMQKAWVNAMHLAGSRMAKYDVKRLDILQEVNPNAYVLGRDVRSPDEDPVFRTTLLRYRMETTGDMATDSSWLLAGEQQQHASLHASGFVIGTQSINPSNNSGAKLLPERSGIEPTARLVWAELAHTFEFLTVVDRDSGEEQYVQIRWAGKTNYGSPFDARRNAADTVSTLLRWELGTIAPAVQLIANSTTHGGDAEGQQREEGEEGEESNQRLGG